MRLDPSATYHVTTAEAVPQGQMTGAEILQRLQRGELKPADACWRKGMADWEEISLLTGGAGMANDTRVPSLEDAEPPPSRIHSFVNPSPAPRSASTQSAAAPPPPPPPRASSAAVTPPPPPRASSAAVTPPPPPPPPRADQAATLPPLRHAAAAGPLSTGAGEMPQPPPPPPPPPGVGPSQPRSLPAPLRKLVDYLVAHRSFWFTDWGLITAALGIVLIIIAIIALITD